MTSTLAQSIYAWGAQVELGAFPTSYIPTTAASVTRAVDTCSMPVASIPGFSTTAGTLVAESIYSGEITGGFSSIVALVGSAQGTDHINQSVSQSNLSYLTNIKNAGTQIYNQGSALSAVVPGAVIKTGSAYWAATTVSNVPAINGAWRSRCRVVGYRTAVPTPLSVFK